MLHRAISQTTVLHSSVTDALNIVAVPTAPPTVCVLVRQHH